jgi:hypothetical protein
VLGRTPRGSPLAHKRVSCQLRSLDVREEAADLGRLLAAICGGWRAWWFDWSCSDAAASLLRIALSDERASFGYRYRGFSDLGQGDRREAATSDHSPVCLIRTSAGENRQAMRMRRVT